METPIHSLKNGIMHVFVAHQTGIAADKIIGSVGI